MPSGQATHIGLGKETIWGTPIGASDYIKFSSESLTLAIEELISTSLAVKRDEPDSYEGLGSIAGDSVHEVHPNALGYLLRSWFGKVLSTNPTGTVYKHIFTPGKDKEAKGTADSGTTTTLIDADLVTTDDEFNGCWVHIISGTNAGTWRVITDSVASGNEISFAAMVSAVDGTSVYEIRNGPEHCILPPYTLEVHRDLQKAFQFAGCVPNTLAFSFGVGAKILNLTATWLGKDVALIDPTSPSWESTEPFRWNQAMLLVGIHDTGTGDAGGTTTSINCSGKVWDGGSLSNKYVRITSGNMKDQIRKITGNSTTRIFWSDSEEMAAAPELGSTCEVWNEENLIETLSLSLSNGLIPVPLLNNTKRISKIVGDVFRSGAITPTFHVEDRTNWETYFKGWTTRPWLVLLRGASRNGGYYYELQFHLPKILFTAYPLGTAGPGRLTVGATGKIKYDATATYLAKAVLFNSKASY